MQASLSIVLDENKVIRLDLLKDVSLTSIDDYTTKKSSSTDIRKEYKNEIDNFLITQDPYTRNFKRQSNKKGSLVIVYEDEGHALHRMRVLYQENRNKLNPDLLLKGICSVIRNEKNPDFTIQMMKYFDFFLGSPFLRKAIEKVQMFPSTEENIRKKQNQRLLNLIRNQLLYILQKDFEKGYFYLRLMDAYIEKKGFQTTKRILDTKLGHIEFSEKNLTQQISIQRKLNCTNSSIVSDGDNYSYRMEEDGQYTFLDAPKQEEDTSYHKYEHFLEEKDHSLKLRGKRK